MTAIGNRVLVQYGIQTEGSNFRAHVCVVAKALYVYRTADGARCASDPRFPERSARTGAIVTATGRLVPPKAIDSCMRTDIPPSILARHTITETDSTTVKGRKATAIVASMMRDGYFPIPLDAKAIPEGDSAQFDGVDILATADLRVQVKCDYAGGEKELGGTGNLFLQTAECNPYQAH